MELKYSAFVPIKLNSTRLPGKNCKMMAGKPLYCWVLETLEQTPCIEEIVIDTDIPEMIDMQYFKGFTKIKVYSRPEALRAGETDMNLILKNRLPDFKNEHIIHTHVTNPLLKVATIEQAALAYEEGLKQGFDSLFSVTNFYKRMYFKGNPVNHDMKKLLPTQQLEPVQEENAILYIFSKEAFLNSGNRIGVSPAMFTMEALESVDIDFMDEFIMAEALLKFNSASGQND